MAEHLETCSACQSALETMSEPDDLMQALAVSDDSDSFAQEAACICFVEHLAAESHSESATRKISDPPANTPSPSGKSEAETQTVPTGVRFGQYILLRQIG